MHFGLRVAPIRPSKQWLSIVHMNSGEWIIIHSPLFISKTMELVGGLKWSKRRRKLTWWCWQCWWLTVALLLRQPVVPDDDSSFFFFSLCFFFSLLLFWFSFFLLLSVSVLPPFLFLYFLVFFPLFFVHSPRCLCSSLFFFPLFFVLFWSCPSVLKIIPPLFFCSSVNLPHTPFLSKDLLYFSSSSKTLICFSTLKTNIPYNLLPCPSVLSGLKNNLLVFLISVFFRLFLSFFVFSSFFSL